MDTGQEGPKTPETLPQVTLMDFAEYASGSTKVSKVHKELGTRGLSLAGKGIFDQIKNNPEPSLLERCRAEKIEIIFYKTTEGFQALRYSEKLGKLVPKQITDGSYWNPNDRFVVVA